jgi:hypothetical protein
MALFQTKNTISSAFCRQGNQRFTVSMTGSVKVGQLDMFLHVLSLIFRFRQAEINKGN